MGWSFPIARIGGTTVKVHLTFLLLLAWMGIVYLASGGVEAALRGLSFLLLLFLSVVLHEFGHIAVARRYGIRSPDIILLPIGGVARLDSLPEAPRQEIAIALAGPAVSLSLAALLLAAGGGLPGEAELARQPLQLDLVVQLGIANLVLGLFNLLPAFPMDGGRVLRALLAARMGYARATRIAAGAGQAFAFALGLLGLAGGNPILLFVALFVYLAAAAEAGIAQMRAAVWGVTAADIMVTEFASLPAAANVGDAAEALLRTSQKEFPVLGSDGAVQGLVTRETLIRALKEEGPAAPVAAALRTDIGTVAPHARGEDCVRMLQGGMPAAIVEAKDGGMLGMVTWENLVDALLIARAERRPAAPRSGPVTAAALP